MSWDEKLRWYGFWAVDRLTGGRVYRYYQEIRESYKRGTSVAKTEERSGTLSLTRCGRQNSIRITRRIPRWRRCR